MFCFVVGVFPLRCSVQTYAWGKLGSQSEVARLFGGCDDSFVVDESTPYAEVSLAAQRMIH